MKYRDLSIEKYLDKLARKTPTPGGGSTAAVFGAIGCALMEMVLNYSDNKNIIVKKSLAVFKNYRRIFLKLIDEDIKAYKRLSSCFKQHGKNDYRTQSALKKATLPPVAVRDKSSEAVKLCKRVLNVANKNLMSDTTCAITSLLAAEKCARLNIGINAKYIKDKNFVKFISKNRPG